MLTVTPPLAILNALTRLIVARSAGMDVGAYDTFLILNLPAHAVVMALVGWALWRERDARAHRIATTAALVFELVTVLPGLWLLGSVEPNLDIVLAMVIIAVARVFYDARIGAVVLATAVGQHVGLAVLEGTGIVRANALFVAAVHQRQVGTYVVSVAWVCATYVLVWALASYVANRNRYFDEVAKIAFSHGGTIDKFIGDAIMVFFGAPEATGERDQAVK